MFINRFKKCSKPRPTKSPQQMRLKITMIRCCVKFLRLLKNNDLMQSCVHTKANLDMHQRFQPEFHLPILPAIQLHNGQFLPMEVCHSQVCSSFEIGYTQKLLYILNQIFQQTIAQPIPTPAKRLSPPATTVRLLIWVVLPHKAPKLLYKERNKLDVFLALTARHMEDQTTSFHSTEASLENRLICDQRVYLMDFRSGKQMLAIIYNQSFL